MRDLLKSSWLATLLVAMAFNLCSQSRCWSSSSPDSDLFLLAGSHAYEGYQPGAVCTPSEPIRAPASLPELVAIIHEALALGVTVKALGARHSTTDIICTEGISVDMRHFRALSYNATDQTVTAGAGATLREVCAFAAGAGRGFRALPGYGAITVGGALGTGAHGSSLRHPATISEQVRRITIVDGLGRVRVITHESELRAFRVHLGLLGVLVSVTLSTAPLQKVLAHNYVVEEDILTGATAEAAARDTDALVLYWFPSTGKVVVSNWTFVGAATPGNAISHAHVPTTSWTHNALAVPSMELTQSAPPSVSLPLLRVRETLAMKALIADVPDVLPIFSEDGVHVQNPAVGRYYSMLAPVCPTTAGWFQCPWLHGPANITFLDNEVAIDLRLLPRFVRTARAVLAATPAAFPLVGIAIRFSQRSDSLMSVSRGLDTAHVEWFLPRRQDAYGTPSAGLAASQALMQTLVYAYGGRSHWAKSGAVFHSTAVLAKRHGGAAFIRAMRAFDPHGVFLNDFGLRLLGVGQAADVDPLTRHCALLDNCVCARNWDCAPGQACTGLDSFPVSVCH